MLTKASTRRKQRRQKNKHVSIAQLHVGTSCCSQVRRDRMRLLGLKLTGQYARAGCPRDANLDIDIAVQRNHRLSYR